MSVRARHSSRPMLLRLVVACGGAFVLAPHGGAQASPDSAPLPTLAGTWYLVTKHPEYDSTIVRPSPPARPHAPTGPVPLVRMDLVRFPTKYLFSRERPVAKP